MKLGLIVRADKTGLGYQTKTYYEHLNPHKTLLVNSKGFNGDHVEQFKGWYPSIDIESYGFPTADNLFHFLQDLDVVLTAETPYNYDLYKMARAMGVKTVCVPNWEFFDYYKYPYLSKPDMLLAPSVWHINDLKKWGVDNNVRVEYLHLPIDRKEFPFRHRTTGVTIHLGGKPATNDRNGTWTYLEAFPNGKLTIQNDEKAIKTIAARYPHSKIYKDLANPQEIYQMGDILVYPRRYGGNSLPLNEALSSGMPVVMPDIEPNNHLLPKEWLVPATTTKYFEPRTKVDIYDVNVEALRKTVAYVKANIANYSLKAHEIANTISWETLKPKYIEVLESL